MFSHGLLHITTKTFIRNLNLQANGRASFRYNKLRRFGSCLQKTGEVGSWVVGVILHYLYFALPPLPNLSLSPRFQLGARPARQRMVPNKRSTGVGDPRLPAARRSPLIGNATTTSCNERVQPLYQCHLGYVRTSYRQGISPILP